MKPSRDVPPTGQSLFFASPKKRNQKKGDPTEAVGLEPTALRCSCFGASRRTRCVHFVHCAQTPARSQLTKRADARGPKPLRSSTPPTGPKSNTVVCCANFPCPTRFARHLSLRLRYRSLAHAYACTGLRYLSLSGWRDTARLNHADAQRGVWRRNRSMCGTCPKHGVDRPNPCSRSETPK